MIIIFFFLSFFFPEEESNTFMLQYSTRHSVLQEHPTTVSE